MKRTLITSFTLCAILTLTAVGQKSTPEAQLGAAIHQEEAEGNLEGAISAYKKFLSQYGNNHPLAAKAQYHLGLSLEKLGNAQARNAYEDVVRKYADQPEIAADAKRRLAALAGQPSSSLISRLLISSESLDAGSMSSDGRIMAMTDWSKGRGGDLAIRDMSTGQLKQLEAGTCFQPAPCAFAEWALLSRDQRQVAYYWWDAEDKNGQNQLRLISNESGAKPRSLVHKPGISMIPGDWSLDGKSLLVVLRTLNTTGAQNATYPLEEVAWVSVNDGTTKSIKSLGWRLLGGQPKLSPDGKFITYAALATNPSTFPELRAQAEKQIYIMAADGSGETQLTTAGINDSPMWSPDGGHVLFVSNRSGTFGLWSVAVREGKAVGSPFLLKRDTGRINPVGMTRSGSLYYVQDQSVGGGGFDIFEAELDANTGLQRSPARLVSERFVGTNGSPMWSPDGKFIAFKRRSVENFDIRNLVVRSVESGEERTYKSPDWTNVSYGFGPGAPKWLHDGNGFFIGDEPILGRSRWLGRMTMEGQFTKLVEIKPELGWVSALSPDDETAYVFSRKDNSPNGAYVGIVAVDLTSGVQKRVFTLPGSGSINSAVVNADGHMLAFFVFSQKDGRNTATLATMQSDGTNYRELYVTAKRVSNVPEQIQWTKDSRALFFLEDGRIMRISVEGRSPEFTGLSSLRPDQQHGMSLRSDGSHIAFTDGAAWSTSKELWALDNLESLLKSSR